MNQAIMTGYLDESTELNLLLKQEKTLKEFDIL